MNLPKGDSPALHAANVRDEWTYSEEAVSLADPIRLPDLVRQAFSYPRFLSIGSIDNTVEIRLSREVYEQIRAVIGGSALSEAVDG